MFNCKKRNISDENGKKYLLGIVDHFKMTIASPCSLKSKKIFLYETKSNQNKGGGSRHIESITTEHIVEIVSAVVSLNVSQYCGTQCCLGET